MLKKTITYIDFDGIERTEDFYFNLTRAEITEMELSYEGGLAKTIDKIIKAKDAVSLIKLFKDLVLKAYGEKSPDGRRFIKTKEVTEEFSQTEGYSVIFMELATNDNAAAAFVTGIVPADIAKKVNEINHKQV